MTSAWCENETLSKPEPPVPNAFACISAISDQDSKDLKEQASRKEVQSSAFVKGHRTV
ncbi:hypothetical protein I79_016853 [Cricetulus griseus]|uniref:Uncharacterized protein n=1 Tax=Cricetulus griseus TaxID=10029 RepID=G3I0G8_CRIGR|nr:hypothetical protein I79_016853 [Cricetulus griseus]